MRLTTLVLPASLFAASFLATTPAAAATRSFPVQGFDKVRSSVPFTVVVKTGEGFGLHAIGPDDALARLRVGVRNGELGIETEPGRFWHTFNWHKEKVILTVTLPRLTGVALSGPGDLSVNAVRVPAFTASLSGPGDLTIAALESEHAQINLSGPGDLTVSGKVGTVALSLSGPGDIRAAGLTATDATIGLSGPGDATITALKTATVTLSGPGDVHVLGHPHCQVTKHGPGDVHCG